MLSIFFVDLCWPRGKGKGLCEGVALCPIMFRVCLVFFSLSGFPSESESVSGVINLGVVYVFLFLNMPGLPSVNVGLYGRERFREGNPILASLSLVAFLSFST